MYIHVPFYFCGCVDVSYVHICKCVHVSLSACIVYDYMCKTTCMYIKIYVYVYISGYTCMYVCMCACIYVCMLVISVSNI